MRKILNSLGARCPNCSERLDLKEVVEEIFGRILERIRDGKDVMIPNFGKFDSYVTKGGKVNVFANNVHSEKRDFVIVEPKRVLTFRSSVGAKKFINKREEEDD